MGFPDGSVVTAQPANAGNTGWIPRWQRSPGGGNGNLLSILAWKTPRTEEPGRLQSTGLQKSWTRLSMHTHCGLWFESPFGPFSFYLR